MDTFYFVTFGSIKISNEFYQNKNIQNNFSNENKSNDEKNTY